MEQIPLFSTWLSIYHSIHHGVHEHTFLSFLRWDQDFQKRNLFCGVLYNRESLREKRGGKEKRTTFLVFLFVLHPLSLGRNISNLESDMNRVFLFMILFAFFFASYRQLTWNPQTAKEEVAVEVPAQFDDSLEGQLNALRYRIDQLESPPPKPKPPKEPIQAFSDGLFDMAKAAVISIVFPLIGAMAFFLGLMKVAEASGLMKIISKLLRPIMIRLFSCSQYHGYQWY